MKGWIRKLWKQGSVQKREELSSLLPNDSDHREDLRTFLDIGGSNKALVSPKLYVSVTGQRRKRRKNLLGKKNIATDCGSTPAIGGF